MRSVDYGAGGTGSIEPHHYSHQAKRPEWARRPYFLCPECHLDRMVDERVAESFPQVEGRQESWSLPGRLAPLRKPSM